MKMQKYKERKEMINTNVRERVPDTSREEGSWLLLVERGEGIRRKRELRNSGIIKEDNTKERVEDMIAERGRAMWRK